MPKYRKVALLGCGRIANKRHIPLLASGAVPGAELAAVCDIDAAKAQEASMKWGVPWFTSGDAMLEIIGPDILAILTPSGLHAQHVRHYLRYGVPLIVEKPLALVLTEAQEVTAAARAAGVPLFTVLQNRFNPPVQRLHEAVAEGRIGVVNCATVTVRWCRHKDYYADWHGTWAMAGGVLMNQAIHHIDLLTWLLGEPESVFAYAESRGGIEVEDTLMGVVRFGGGMLASIEVTAATRPTDLEGSITVLGDYGTVKVGGFAVNKMEVWQFGNEKPADENIRALCDVPPDVYGYGHKLFYQHVLERLDLGVPSSIDPLPALQLVTALYQSVEQRREVCLCNGIEPVSERLGIG